MTKIMEIIKKTFYLTILLQLFQINSAESINSRSQKWCGQYAEVKYGINRNEVQRCRYVGVKLYSQKYPAYQLEIDGIGSLYGNYSNPSIIGDNFLVQNSLYDGNTFYRSPDFDTTKLLKSYYSLYSYSDKISLLLTFNRKLHVNGIINNKYMIRSSDNGHLLIEFKNPIESSLGNFFSHEYKPYDTEYSSSSYQKNTIDLNIIVDNIYLQSTKTVAMNTLIYWNAAIMLFLDNELKLHKPIKEIKISTIDILQSVRSPEALKIYDNKHAHTGNLDSFINENFRTNDRLSSDFQVYMTTRKLCFNHTDTKCPTPGYLLNLNRNGQRNYTKSDIAVLKHTSSFMNYPLAADKLFELLDDKNYIYIYIVNNSTSSNNEINAAKPSATIYIEVPKEDASYVNLKRRLDSTARNSSLLLDKITEIAKIGDTSFDSNDPNRNDDENTTINWQEMKNNAQEFVDLTNVISKELPEKKLNKTHLLKLNKTITKMDTFLDNLNDIIDLDDEIEDIY